VSGVSIEGRGVEARGPVPRVRREEVRRRLLDAAAEVFAEKGYAAARLDEVAYRAGFTKGAVYSNFAGKHALLAELIEDRVRTQFAVNTDEIRDRGRPDRAIEDIAEVYAHGIVQRDVWTRLLVEISQQAGHDPEVRQVFVGVRQVLRDELATLLDRAAAGLGLELRIPAEQLALTLQSLRMGLALEHGTDPEQVDEAAIAAVFRTVLQSAVSSSAPDR
jgi:AcrR family transcriptional regulator